MKRATLFLLLKVMVLPAASQVITGTITTAGEAVSFATIRVVHTNLGAAASEGGVYELMLPQPGTYEIAFSAVGFASQHHVVTLAPRDSVRLDVSLAVATYEANAVVVTGTLEQVGLRESPVRVEVVPPRFLQFTPSASVMDALGRINGLYQQIDCGVCYTNNIRINGADGPNTAMLIDGMPIMSSLAAVYGLNGISPMLVRQIEVVKGPISTLYGSEALGGVINILTKSASTAPALSVSAFSTSRSEFAAEFAAVPWRGRRQAIVSGTFFAMGDYHDNNGDGFSDRPLTTRAALFAKVSQDDRYGFARGSVAAKVYYERRNAGTSAFLDDPHGLRGSARVYGESIFTHRAEMLANYLLRPDLQLRASGAWHKQDSFYGTVKYFATQTDAFGQLNWTPRVYSVDGHSFLAGAAVRLVRYDDDTAATGGYDDAGNLLENRPDTRFIPGLLVQDDWQVSHRLRFLAGLRGDYQRRHGLIVSPRVAVKWQPNDRSTLRLNAGTGFREVNLTTEDHAAYSGGRATLVLEELMPERSVSTTASVRHVFGSLSPITVELDAFWTRFSNKIEPDYSVPNQIRYRNLAGSATTRGVSLSVQGVMGSQLRYTAGATVLDVFLHEGGAQRAVEFAPDFQGTATATWDAPRGIAVDYSLQLTGPMALPYFAPDVRQAYQAATGRPLRPVSPAYLIHSIQVSKTFDVGRQLLQCYAALENAFDYHQSSPIVGYYEDNPGFGSSFDTSYVYGPIAGRQFGLGVRLTRR